MGKLADALREDSKNDDIIIVGSDIRAALTELELEVAPTRRVVMALHALLVLKELKDQQGKVPKYRWLQPTAWDDARHALAEFWEAMEDQPNAYDHEIVRTLMDEKK